MRTVTLWLLFIGVAFLLGASTFTLPEHSQALRLQLGKIQGAPVTKAGLYFKLPFIEEVRFFDKRLLQWDGEPTEVPTRDRKFIWVDTTARWRIKDALAFYKALRDIPTALSRMGTILNGVTKDTISTMNLIETVRTSNDIIVDIKRLAHESSRPPAQNTTNPSALGIPAVVSPAVVSIIHQDERALELAEASSSVEEIKIGREKIAAMITERAQKELFGFGIELVDVQLRSIAYKEVVEQKVYKRMISERNKIAMQIRSMGAGEKAKILGQLDLALKKIESEAYRKSQELRGHAEGEAARIYAAVFQEDPEFFNFIKTLDVYKKTMSSKTHLLLSTDNALFQIFQKGF